MRKPIVVGNWKMNGTSNQIQDLVKSVDNGVKGLSSVDVVLSPPSIFITKVKELTNKTNLKISAQNCCYALSGAYTGEISPSMLQEFGCEYVILGHSERRQLFAETDKLIAKKFLTAYKTGIKPILCIGETLEERQNNQTLSVIDRQLDAVIAVAGIEAFTTAIVAYEPVWAIGSGISATPEQAEQVHAYIREKFAKHNLTIAEQVRILYGGSVNVKNAEELFSQTDIDGGLIGGASLKAEEFIKICSYAETKVMV